MDRILAHYEKLGDLQMLATMVCVLGKLLNPSYVAKYDRYIRCYAELLHRWGALEKRAEVLKCLGLCAGANDKKDNYRKEENSELEIKFSTSCRRCGKPNDPAYTSNNSKHLYCPRCNDYIFKCSICQMAVRGSFLVCIACGECTYIFSMLLLHLPIRISLLYNIHTHTHTHISYICLLTLNKSIMKKTLNV